ncbi:TcfC E-set like domain-containing protein [Pandoraea anhela]|nr:TcfC E-set like domain-containing protein [Pandoraea anhela]
MSTVRHTYLVCLSWLLLDANASQAGPMDAVPPGFEDIALGQVEHVDVRLLGHSLGVFPVFVDPNDVRLETPEAVVRAIEARMTLPVPASSTAAPASLIEVLGKPMPRNGHLACAGAAVQTGCWYLETASAGAIFDETQGVLELFLAKDWLPAENTAGPAFHTNSPGSERALVHTQVVNASTRERYRNLTVLGNGALGISPASYAGFTWSLVHASSGAYDNGLSVPSDGTRASVDSLYYRHDLGATHYVQAGRMDQRNLSSAQGGSFGFSLLPVERFDGARIGTSQAYLNEAVAAQGSPLTVLLTRDSRVDAYRGSELLGSAYLPAGVQQFDTRYFPEGAYLVTLRIVEGDRLVRTETEPYTKVGGAMFGRGTQWFVQAGRTVNRRRFDDPNRRERLTVQSGVRTSFGQRVTLTSGLVWLPSQVFNETQVSWQHAFALGRVTTTAALLMGTGGARGNTQSISFSNGMGLSLYRYQMRQANCGSGPFARDVDAISLGCYDSLNASVSVPLGKWQGSAGYSQSRAHGARTSYAAAPGDDPFWNGRAQRAGVSRTLQATLSRSFRWERFVINTRVGGYRRHYADVGRPDAGAFVNLSVSMHRPALAGASLSTFSSGGVDVRMGNTEERGARVDYHASHAWTWDDTSRREIAVGLSGTENGGGTANVRGAVDGRYGDVQAMFSRSFGNEGVGSASGAFSGSYASSFAVMRDRVVVGPAMLAGEPPAGVALVVSDTAYAGDDADALDPTEAATDSAAATLQVGGRPLTVDFGAAAMTPIGGYRVQQGEVAEAWQGLSDYSVGVLRGAGPQDYFLTPGRMKVHRVTATRSYTYVGRAIGPDGLSLDNARVLSVAAPPLDAHGEFMIESSHPLSALYLLDRGQPMRCEIRNVERRDVVRLTGTMQCDVVAQQSLPQTLQSQSRVQRLLIEAKARTDRRVGVSTREETTRR